MEELLIEKVRNRPIIYDMTSYDYRDKEKRLNAWKEIGEELNISANTAKETWQKLRRCLMNAINRRRNNKNDDGAKETPPWKFQKKMSFLLPSVEVSAIEDNVKLERKHTNLPNNDTIDTQYRISNIQTECDDNSNIINNKRKRGGRDSCSQQMDNSTVKQMRYEGEGILSNRHLDDTDMFFLSLAKTTKTLPPLEQAKIKLQVSRIVLQAQIVMEEQQHSG